MKKLLKFIAFSCIVAITAENIYAKNIRIHNSGPQTVEVWQKVKNHFVDATSANNYFYGPVWGAETKLGTITAGETQPFTLADSVGKDKYEIQYLIKDFNKPAVDTTYRPAIDKYFDGHKKDTMQF
ncbi:hypothetical protein [Candidatus Chromulinivorax destructor]|uniref:Uncharacterized protein n=1 Tax=Candidatus Chromulinivorax destructor TaxID=2066483 RepID=A0A345ZB80_9BACT|nr:hypothetical protein [Candidatus Chromulinivorax destructor]AXK60547.1 hypothetical protein C0J27_02190 [Candidatus Chromulinivorax destructor]